jgi:outer membrane protein OmpU
MNKLKKVGLTALATTLVASSAYAGELSVSGSASLNYSGLSTASDANPYTMGDSITFTGSGDLENGMDVTVKYEIDNAGGGHPIYDDYSLTLGLGDGNGSLTFSGDSVNAGGVDTVKDIVPTAYTPVYENTDATDNGLAITSGRNTTGMWGYSNTIAGLGVSLGYNPKNSDAHQDAETSIGLTYDVMDGLTVVAGRMDDDGVAENDTVGLKYTMGNVTAAYQITNVNFDATATADQDAAHYGISLAVNENLSVSAGRQVVEIDGAADDETNTGFNASYTMGSITIAGGYNDVNSIGGATGSDAEVSMLNVSFAF